MATCVDGPGPSQLSRFYAGILSQGPELQEASLPRMRSSCWRSRKLCCSLGRNRPDQFLLDCVDPIVTPATDMRHWRFRLVEACLRENEARQRIA